MRRRGRRLLFRRIPIHRGAPIVLVSVVRHGGVRGEGGVAGIVGVIVVRGRMMMVGRRRRRRSVRGVIGIPVQRRRGRGGSVSVRRGGGYAAGVDVVRVVLLVRTPMLRLRRRGGERRKMDVVAVVGGMVVSEMML